MNLDIRCLVPLLVNSHLAPAPGMPFGCWQHLFECDNNKNLK